VGLYPVVFFLVVRLKGNLSKRGMSYSDRKFASTSVTDTDESSLSIIGKDQAQETTNHRLQNKEIKMRNREVDILFLSLSRR
jgi:hypothetical protein